ncbi:MAG TPA: sulfatase-like hydrolase/transferase [Opitutus sp.]|nr:sulfatase-like hydrolase/transferase [Opitutus sp.]
MIRPDILWIVTTQWRGQALGCAGDVNARTPFLDRFATDAVRFAQAVTPHPFGPFARAALLTGIRSPENGVRDYFDPLPAAARTIAHEVNELGYTTAFFGKWHLAPRDPSAALVGEAHARTLVPPERRGGFAFWEGFESGFLLNDPWLHGTRMPEPNPFRGYQSEVVSERAAAWLHDQTGPWFAVVSLEPPHPPYAAPAAGVAPCSPDELLLPANVPRGGEIEARARRELAGYYAHIEATDRAIGRLIAQLDAAAEGSGRAAPIVVFTSVHGDMHGAHGLFRKGWPHEESVRVPLLVRARGQKEFAAGVTDQALVTLLDVHRWTLAWARGGCRGEGRVAEAQTISMPSVVALPQQCDRPWRAVRTATRKLVVNDDGSPWWLFDLERDPLEQKNLVDDPAWRGELSRLAAAGGLSR